MENVTLVELQSPPPSFKPDYFRFPLPLSSSTLFSLITFAK
jgi:hypothetical protein